MSFQTFVTERLAAITAQLNAIATNAKKIFELPAQSTLEPRSLIHVSRDGISESLSLQKIIDVIVGKTFSHLLEVGEITVTGLTVSVPAGAKWVYENVYYSTLATTNITETLCAVGFLRKDILVANQLNQIVLIKGAESETIRIIPNVPIGSVLVTEIDVDDTVVGTPSIPVTIQDLLSKLDRGGYAGTAQDLKDEIDEISLPDQILVYGEAPVTAGTVNIAAGDFQWRISKVEYTNPIYSNVISPAATGYTRFDLFCVNNLGTFEKVVGDEEIGAAPKPSPNPGTLEAFFIEINGAVISDPVPAPSPGGNKQYIQKAEFASISALQSGVINFVILETIQNKILLSGNATQLRSINHWANQYLFSGRDLYIINEGTVDCLIKHLYAGQGAYTFSFPNEDDFTLHPKEQIHFKLKLTTSGHGIYEYVGVINALPTIEIADVTGLTAELATKLDASAYNQHFKGVYVTLAALNIAHPTASVGDYAQVNEVGATDVVNYNWDAEDNVWVEGGGVGGAANTDALPEGSGNLYHTSARVLATLLSGISFVTGGAIVSTDSVLVAFGKIQKQISDLVSGKQNQLTAGTNISIDVTDPLNPVINSTADGDMTTTTAQTVSGLKTFLSGMFGLRNSANTFTSFFTNANTASRTYSLQDRTGILADLADIASVNTNKMNVPTGGIANYLPKFLTSTTQGLSRLWDTGTFLGIDTVNAPTKDITLGNQNDKEIGVEESSNNNRGKDLTIRAGRTINYIPNNNFLVINSPGASYNMSTFAPNGDVIFGRADGNGTIRALGAGDFTFFGVPSAYPADMVITKNNNFYYVAFQNYYGGSPSNLMYEQINRIGAFNQLIIGNSNKVWVSVTTDLSTGDVYFAEQYGGIYKRTADTGDLVSLGVTSRNWKKIRFCSDGSLYAILNEVSDVLKLTNMTGDFAGIGATARAYESLSTSGNGDVFVSQYSNIYKKESGSSALILNLTTPSNIYTLQVMPNGSIYYNGINGLMYFQNNDQLGSANLEGGKLKLKTGTGKGDAPNRLEFYTGQKTASGTDMQVETLREYIDENGYHVYTSMPVYADNAAAITGGLPVGCEYRTATGVKMIVY